jgi:hypothetical protein
MRAAIQAWMIKLPLDRGQPATVLFADTQDPMTLLGGGGLILASTFSITV